MYIIGDVISHVKKKCELFIKMHIVISGAGTRNLTAGVHKSPKNAKFLLTPAQNRDIISISRIIDPHIAFALRFITYALHFSTSVLHFGAKAGFNRRNAVFMRVLAKQSVIYSGFTETD